MLWVPSKRIMLVIWHAWFWAYVTKYGLIPTAVVICDSIPALLVTTNSISYRTPTRSLLDSCLDRSAENASLILPIMQHLSWQGGILVHIIVC
jgi:hypothetical protein